MRASFPRFGLVVIGVQVLVASPVAAQEIQWRHDYAAARREAKEKNRPLLVDFGTAHCTWCQKLDAITFRDPTVAKTLNERFIPVKVDAQRDPQLAQLLGIHAFPTLLFAAPDGKILDKEEGFVDAAPLAQRLQRALAQAPPDRPALPLQVAMEPAAPSVRTTVPPADPLQGDVAALRADRDRLADHLGEVYLGLADNCLRLGQPRQAKTYLERVLQLCPGTSHATAAQALLTKMPADGGTP